MYFFSTPADPGFTALLDGEVELKIYRANLGMAAVIIPAGKHTLEFRYFTPGLESASYISLSALLICLLIFFIDYRKYKIKHAVE